MSGWILASRLIAAFLLVMLLWNEIAPFQDAGTEAEAAETMLHRGNVTSRGDPRPPAGNSQGPQVLIAQPHVRSSPTPPRPPASPTPTPTAVTEQLRDLGTFKVTGYSDSVRNGTDGRGVTRSGEKTRWGVVAVDPSVIPLGSRLVIEGMGTTVFTALDTGGAIIGRRIDIWFPTDWDALQHGLRNLRVQAVIN